MATDRNKSKSNTKSSSSGNKKTARAADTSKRASQDRQAEKKKGAKEEKKDALVTVKHRSANTREITAIVMVSVCIFVVVCMLGKAGIVGAFVKDVLYGVFGLVGTILLLIAVLVLSFSILRGTQSQTFTGRTTATMIFFFLFLTALFHSLSNCFDSYVAEHGQNYKFLPVFLSLWKSHEVSPFGGGLIAGGVEVRDGFLTDRKSCDVHDDERDDERLWRQFPEQCHGEHDAAYDDVWRQHG